MPKLSALQFSKIFSVGLVGYFVIISILIFGSSLIFPNQIKQAFDMSIDTFLKMSLIYFMLSGIIAAPLMALSAWLILGTRARTE